MAELDDETLEDTDDDTDAVSTGRTFVIITKDFSGLGWAKKLQEEGEEVVLATDYSDESDPKLRKTMQLVGQGWFDVCSIDDALEQYASDSTYWVFAENAFPDFAARLKEAGQKYFPPNMELGDKLEHDRTYATDLAEESGLEPPVTHEFTTLDEALAFLDDNPETAYVFKPDSSEFNYLTFVPVRVEDADANRDVYDYLAHMKDDPGSFILQERIAMKDALEVNVEVWLQDGEPFLALLGLECKRKNTGDLGEMAGCAGDFVTFIPLDSPLVAQTIGKMLPFYKDQKYSGFADVNVLITPDGIPHFLEVCNRFGYNAHVTTILGLANAGFGDIIADYVDGDVEGAQTWFRDGWAGSVCLFVDHPRAGLPIYLSDAVADQYYPFDGQKEDDQLLTTGYSTELGILVESGPSIPAIADKLMAHLTAEHVSVPDMYYRTDLGATTYRNAPARRWKELQQRGLV